MIENETSVNPGDKSPRRELFVTTNLPKTNQEFLEAIFGTRWREVPVTQFAGDPMNAGNWSSIPAWQMADGDLAQPLNNYYTVSLFHPTKAGKTNRRIENFDGLYVLVIDDVGEKIPAGGLPAPSFVVGTSPQSNQFGYILTDPITNILQANALINGAIRSVGDGKDPGMAGVTRNVRLPIGSNTKEKYGSPSPRCELLHWDPSVQWDPHMLATALGFDLDQETNKERTPAPAGTDYNANEDPIYRTLETAGQIKGISPKPDGWLEITCPFVHEHTGHADTGAAFNVLSGNIHCHHGHCKSRHQFEFREEIISHWEDEFRAFNLAAARAAFPEDPPPEVPEETPSPPEVGEGLLPEFDAGLAPRPWVDETEFLLYGSVVSLAGAPGVSKSTMTLDLLARLMFGLIKTFDKPAGDLKAIYISADDDVAEVARRLWGWCLMHNITEEEIAGLRKRLMVIGATEAHKYRLGDGDKNPDGQTFKKLARQIKEFGADIFVIDPVANILGVSENDNSAIAAIMGRLAGLSQQTRSSILMVQHSRKMKSDEEASLSDLRGASAFGGAVRAAKYASVMSPDEATRHGVPQHYRHRFVKVVDVKASYRENTGKEEWYERVTVQLPNGTGDRPGDKVAVTRRWEPPSHSDFADVTKAALLNLIYEAGESGTPVGLAHNHSRPILKETSGIGIGENVARMLLQWATDAKMIETTRRPNWYSAGSRRQCSGLALTPDGEKFRAANYDPNWLSDLPAGSFYETIHVGDPRDDIRDDENDL